MRRMSESGGEKAKLRGRLRRAGARRAGGAGIVEGVVGITLIVIAAAFGGLLMLNCSQAAIYKQKLGLVSSSAAALAASMASWDYDYNPGTTDGVLENDLKPSIDKALRAMGLPNATRVIVHREFSGSPGGSISVTVTVGDLPVIGHSKAFPRLMSISDTCVAPLNNNEPAGLMAVELLGAPNLSETLPVYGKFLAPFSNGRAKAAGAPPGTAVFLNFPKKYMQAGLSFTYDPYRGQAGPPSETDLTVQYPPNYIPPITAP